MRFFIVLCSLGFMAACQKHPHTGSIVPEENTKPSIQPTSIPSPTPTVTPPAHAGTPCDNGQEGYLWVDARLDKDGDSYGSETLSRFCMTGEIDAALKEQGYVRVKADEVLDQCDNNQLLTKPQRLFWDRDHDQYATEEAGISCDNPNADQIVEAEKQGSDDCDQIPFKYQLISAFHDKDRDSFGTTESLAVCVGAQGIKDEALEGYVIDNSNPRIVDECDDIPAKYRYVKALDDKDHDGYGQGAEQVVCIGSLGEKDESLGDKILFDASKGKDDCDDIADKFRWIKGFQDKDRDGWGVGQESSICVDSRGTEDPLFAGLVASSERKGQDCNDDDKDLNKVTFVWKDRDGDAFGAGGVSLLCTTQSEQDLLSLGWSKTGYDSNDDDSAVVEDEDEMIEFFLVGG